MVTRYYSLQPDPEWNGWRLQKIGSNCAESIFASKEEALRKLPEAIEHGGAVSVRDGDGHVEATVIIA